MSVICSRKKRIWKIVKVLCDYREGMVCFRAEEGTFAKVKKSSESHGRRVGRAG
ncbi:MAG: hypothetical protein ACYS76_13095 [Planctomycetota bacterium]